MKRVIAAALLALLVLAGVLVARALRLRSHQVVVTPIALEAIDATAAAAHLGQAVQFRTVTHSDAADHDRAAFGALHDFLGATYPTVQRTLTRETVAALSLLYTWPGSDPQLPPVLLLAHQDVVPVEATTESDWTHPAFSGTVADGFVWGRGTLDDKGNLIALLEAAEHLARAGFAPRRTIILAFGHDEEGAGTGAAAIAALLQARRVAPQFVLDEGVMVQGAVPGIGAPIALVGIAEKGALSVELVAESAGGHSAAPPRETTVGMLANAIVQLEGHPLPARLDGVAAYSAQYAAAEMPLLYRLGLANLWLLNGVALRLLPLNPAFDATVRTTTAATMLEGSPKDNVLAPRARAVINHRILPGDTMQDVIAHDRAAVADTRVAIRALEGGRDPSAVSDPNAPEFTLLSRTIREVFPDAVVVPNLAIGATDARQYDGLTHNIYRYAPILFHEDDLVRFHGKNERLDTRALGDAIRFYVRLMRNAAG